MNGIIENKWASKIKNAKNISIGEFIIIGHRGDRVHAPENTIPSFEKGIKCKANVIEFGIRVTKDGSYCGDAWCYG